MDAKHTPGPWIACRQFVETPANKDGFRCWIEVCSGRNMTTKREGVSRAEKQANAALIAAAPKLYSFVATLAESGNTEALEIIKEITNAS